MEKSELRQLIKEEILKENDKFNLESYKWMKSFFDKLQVKKPAGISVDVRHGDVEIWDDTRRVNLNFSSSVKK